MKTSVIIPLFNKAETIERTLRSVLLQSIDNHEIIIIDDGSTDGSGARVRPFLSNQVRLYTQVNAGPGAARNRGASFASGDLLAFLDADDEWKPTFLAEAVRSLERFPEALAYVCGYDALDYRSERPNKAVRFAARQPSMPDIDESGWEIKARCDGMHSSACVIRRASFFAAGGFFERDKCLYGEDSFLWLCVLLSGPIFWDARENVIFHVANSALGYAQQSRRMVARPLSLHGLELESRVQPEYVPALKRTIESFADMDINLLRSSRAYAAASELMEQYPSLKQKHSPYSRAKRKLKWLTGQVFSWLARK